MNRPRPIPRSDEWRRRRRADRLFRWLAWGAAVVGFGGAAVTILTL